MKKAELKIKLELVKLALKLGGDKDFIEFTKMYRKLEKLVLFN